MELVRTNPPDDYPQADRCDRRRKTDLNGDSLLDLATANYSGDSVTILFNESTPAAHPKIDIKPGSDSNPINPWTRGNIPVAILGSDVFDVMDVDVTKLAFGAGAAAPSHDLSKPGVLEGHLEDINSDGFTDLVSHYPIADSGMFPHDTTACLIGKTLAGASFTACDSIRVIPGR